MSQMPKNKANQPGPALVTGASDRIGAAIARALAAAGHAVVIHYRSGAEAAPKLPAEIAATGGRAAIIQADLADRAAPANVIAEAAKPFGPLTILINNASVFDPDSARDVNEEIWDRH